MSNKPLEILQNETPKLIIIEHHTQKKNQPKKDKKLAIKSAKKE